MDGVEANGENGHTVDSSKRICRQWTAGDKRRIVREAERPGAVRQQAPQTISVIAMRAVAGCLPALQLAVLYMPSMYAALPSSSAFALPSASGTIALLGVASYLSGVMAFWVYLVPLEFRENQSRLEEGVRR